MLRSSGRFEPSRCWGSLGLGGDTGQGRVWGLLLVLAGLPKNQVSANLGCIGKVCEMHVVHLGNLSDVLLAGE